MPSIALVLAGYAAYVQYEKSKSAKYDAKIDLAGKRSVSLMPFEEEMSVLQFPICTLTFCRGNHRNVVPFLEQRVYSILKANPWLSGWLIRDAKDECKVKIFFDESCSEKPSGHFEVFEPLAPLPLTQEKNQVREYEHLLKDKGVIIPLNRDLIGRNLPFWKVSVVPCGLQPNENFALIVSMSHAAGDAHTYYQLYNMLDQDASVQVLQPERVPTYRDALAVMIGSESEASYLTRALAHPLVDMTGSSNEAIAMKAFYIDEDWALNRKSNRESVFANVGTASDKVATVVSLNSTLTSWFFRINQASLGLMAVELRHRLDGHGCHLDDRLAGNYLHTIVYTPSDYRSPGLVQQSLRNMKRCGPDTPDMLPNLGWNMTCSLSNDWSKFYRNELYLHDDVSTSLHLPLWNLHVLASLPNRLSSLHVFTARPCGIDGSERRLGAVVLCRESVWATIKESGIVDEMIVDF